MISIILPTHNRAQLVVRAIQSVTNQTFKEWELVIVDDGSKDNTSEAVKPFLSDLRVKYIPKENSGAAHTRNVGVANSRYDWITFLDSDDEVKPEWLEVLSASIREGHLMVSCGVEYYNPDGSLNRVIIPRQNDAFTGGQYMSGTYIIQKKIFDAVGGFDPVLRANQQTELSYRLKPYFQENGIKTHILKTPLLKVHIHPGHRIRTDFAAKYEGYLYCYSKHYNGSFKEQKIRSTMEGNIAFNAFMIGKRREAIAFARKAYATERSFKNLARLARYVLNLKTIRIGS
ncbi:glycosyltransferase family A protein [Chryseolinea sp. T2]|uniref:glycosyltransferase family 2 protein n=1 Tax=Chryseolinea sp. T2 TaxID=3129255 RepID=UPI003077D66F